MAINFDELPKSEQSTEMVELFTLNGKTYSIPRKPRINVALKFLDVAKREGQDLAAGFLLEEVIGREGYEALMDYEDLTPEQFQEIVLAAQKVVLGGLEGPKETK